MDLGTGLRCANGIKKDRQMPVKENDGSLLHAERGCGPDTEAEMSRSLFE